MKDTIIIYKTNLSINNISLTQLLVWSKEYSKFCTCQCLT